MTAPYRRGDRAAYLSADVGGISVRETTVEAVEREGEGWSVRTADGIEHVDDRGEGSRLVPLDQELEFLIETQDGRALVRSAQDEAERDAAEGRDIDRDPYKDAGR